MQVLPESVIGLGVVFCTPCDDISALHIYVEIHTFIAELALLKGPSNPVH